MRWNGSEREREYMAWLNPFRERCHSWKSTRVAILLAMLLFALLAYFIQASCPVSSYGFHVFPSVRTESANLSCFNDTILAFAEIDLSDALEQHQVQSIVDGTWGRDTGARRLPSRTNLEDKLAKDVPSQAHEMEKLVAAKLQTIPFQLSSPKYARYWPQFLRLLQEWAVTKKYDPGIMKQLLQLIKDPVDRHYLNKGIIDTHEPDQRYKTCAVVGNGGILLKNNSYGGLIDGNEMVMRINNAKVHGLEQFVGSKTTLAFINGNILQDCSRQAHCFCHPYGENVPIITYLCQVSQLMDVVWCGKVHTAPIIVTDPRFNILCTRIVKYYSVEKFVATTGRPMEDWNDVHDGLMFHYSSGFQAVMLALGICEKVSLFGFGKSPDARHHYHSRQTGELLLHHYEAEYQIYDDLAHGRYSRLPFLDTTTTTTTTSGGFEFPIVEIHRP